LYWQIRGLGALEDKINIRRPLPELINWIGSVGYQPAARCEAAKTINRRQTMVRRQTYDDVTIL
jgi:hypothetical protein